MLKNYLLVTFRNLSNNRLFSLLNILGLAIGLSACFMIWQYVRFETSYDNFHKNAGSLYRIGLGYTHNEGQGRKLASNFGATGHAMQADLPEVKEYCRLVKTSLFTSDLGSYFANALEFSWQNPDGDLIAFNEENVWFADAPILTMFSFPLIAGTDAALKEPNSVVITESMARKYFGTTPALGQELRLNRELILKVTGVVRDVPANSHLQFDILISLATMKARVGDLTNNWGWAVFYNYVQLSDEADVKALESKLDDFKMKYVGPEENSPSKTYFFLQPVKSIHLDSQLEEEQSPNGSHRIVYFLSILAAFILVIAVINYINLSTAKSLERAREVGLRKTLGASRKQLLVQFLFDTIVINFIALFTAFLIVVVSWNTFEELTGKEILSVVFTGGLQPWIASFLVFVAAVLVAGLYPALTLSSFNPSEVLKGKFIRSSSGSLLRKSMVSFQYMLAVLLVAGTVLIYLQLSHMRSIDRGFTSDQILVVGAPAVYDSTAGQKISFFRNGTLQLPGVENVSATSDVPGRLIVESSPVGPVKAQDESQFFHTTIASIDTNFFATLDIPLLHGRLFGAAELMTFRRNNADESIPVIVNEEFLRRSGVKNAEDALETEITFWWGPDQRFARIIGVVANHHQLSMKEGVLAVMYVQPGWDASKYFAIRMKGDPQTLIKNIERRFGQAFAGHPFSYFFLDEFFDKQYQNEDHFSRIFNVFTGLAMLVTSLGLLGLSIFSVSQRTKEMGIRKVLGASSGIILFLFSRDFLRVLVLSYVLALPLIIWVGERWLSNFTFRIAWQWPIFVVPLILLMGITFITILVVSLKAATQTPVNALRQE